MHPKQRSEKADWAKMAEAHIAAARRKRKSIQEGSWVRHRESGWAGVVTKATHVDQRTLVTVKPTRPRPLEVLDKESGRFVPTPDDWDGWRPVTVWADELLEWSRK